VFGKNKEIDCMKRILIIDNIEELEMVKGDFDIILFRCPYCKKVFYDIDAHWEICEEDPLGLSL
jgi:hypothetical protein